jgi:hypothetical protein
MSTTRSGRASNASDPSQESSPAVDGAALGAQLAELAAAVKEIAAQQSQDVMDLLVQCCE